MERKIASGIMLMLLLTGMLALALNIQPAKAEETIYIRADGSVDPATAPIQRKGDVYTFTDNMNNEIVVERSNIVIDGAGYKLQGSGSGSGFYLPSTNNVTIQNTNVRNFMEGVFLLSSSYNVISGNNLTDESGVGVRLLYSSTFNTVRENNLTNNYEASIWLYSSSYNTISRNNIANNLFYGVGIDSSSDNNIVSGNNIANNHYVGIHLYHSNNNRIYHNNFINNGGQGDVTAGYGNTWDDGYPSGGNYWSDYSGVDANGDRIGDTPYIVDANNQDRYPLMSRWVEEKPVERKVGVNVGDWAKYNVDTSWMGVLSPYLEMWTEMEWGIIEVTDVQGTVVTFTGIAHFKNGSELTTPGADWDVAPTGSFGFIFWFIGSNLQAGDKVYPSGAVAINETVARTYCGDPRENNHLNGSTSGSAVPGPPYDQSKLDCYWDQATGILTEELLECSTEDLSSSLWIHLKMVDTNLWEAPTPPTIMARVDIDPDTLNLESNGKWITAYIQLPEGYGAVNINASTILLNRTIPPVLDPKYGFVKDSSGYLIDYNNDGILGRMVKFGTASVESFITSQGIGNAALTITGKLLDGTPFEGTDTISVSYGGPGGRRK